MDFTLIFKSVFCGLSNIKKIIAGNVMHAAMTDTSITALRQPSVSIPEPRISGNMAPPTLEDMSNNPVAIPRLP